jgi:WD40-like Beta Propeller Repeat
MAYVDGSQSAAGHPLPTEILLTIRAGAVRPAARTDLIGLPVPFAFSPDGTELAFVAPNSSRISIVNVRTPTNGPGPALVSGISWSINGTIAFAASANSSIYTIGVNGAGLRRMTQPPPRQNSASMETTTVDLTPEWSPDGASLMFDRQVQSTALCGGCAYSDDTDDVEVVPADGGRPHMIWSGGTGSWSPDGKKIAVTSLRGGAMDGVWIVGAAGGSPKQIVGLNWVSGSLPSVSLQSVGSPLSGSRRRRTRAPPAATTVQPTCRGL